MNRQKADRIIVTSNDRMHLVLDWYIENKDWLKREQFRAPMEAGVIELREEALEVTFEVKSETRVELAVYPTQPAPNIPAVVTYDYDPQTTVASNFRIAPHLPQEKRDLLRLVLLSDNTTGKEALKYHALMLFMTHYREVIEVEEQRVRNPGKLSKRGKKKKPLPLIRRAYVLTDFDRAALPKPDGVKRSYTKPDHEVNVRGHLRRYKSGKTVWIQPSVRYKGKTASPKEYQL